jgi:hypothetical protein
LTGNRVEAELCVDNQNVFFVYLINLCKTVNTVDKTVEFKEEC